MYKGRQKTAQRHKETILQLHGQGMGVSEILKQIRRTHAIGQSSVYPIIADYRRQTGAEVAGSVWAAQHV